MSTEADIQVLEYDAERSFTRFELRSSALDRDELTTPLVFELLVHPTDHPSSSSITLNRWPLDIEWTGNHSSAEPLVVAPRTRLITAVDQLGSSHALQIALSGKVALSSASDPSNPQPVSQTHGTQDQDINLQIESVDGSATRLGFILRTSPTIPRRRLLSLTSINSPQQTVHFEQLEELQMVAQSESHSTDDTATEDPPAYDEDAFDIDAEIESLLLLEAEASQLHGAIAAKKGAIAKCLKDHRDDLTLKHLLQQCDGLFCAAKVIAQRLCDKMGILTIPEAGYARVQDPNFQQLVELHESNEKARQASKLRTSPDGTTTNTTRVDGLHAAAAIQPVEVVYPQNVLLRVLGVISTALGLAAFFSYLRRQCMSMRRRVERAADAEERRNERAYRRAARRAKMRRRWDAFVEAINCFRSPPEPPNSDYDEKRALILQDAFLEQDIDAAEKGDLMEAEIRELRHAHEIVASLVRVDENRYDMVRPINDPPPSMVPLPCDHTARSRASTATTGNPPSYFSESLPDYTSRYQRTETASIGSSLRSSLRSSSVATVDGSDLSNPSNTASATDSDSVMYTGSTTRSHRSDTSTGTRTSRYTPASSIVETSPRASDETLRTGYRNSRWSRVTDDTL
ncbi:Hypothetical predicted protein [Lecanosticta acicola]|uniref:Uncharacterized protein n=1 Tax=Lecanosticta acicola TaxID=111012 RepID=A0AAI8Z8Z8_9PEZI|nr:Hypothetical predicted protein [Lecanosticta acicola]